MDRIYPFKDCVGTHIVLNPRHVQNRDWAAVADYTNLETPSAWKKYRSKTLVITSRTLSRKTDLATHSYRCCKCAVATT